MKKINVAASCPKIESAIPVASRFSRLEVITMMVLTLIMAKLQVLGRLQAERERSSHNENGCKFF